MSLKPKMPSDRPSLSIKAPKRFNSGAIEDSDKKSDKDSWLGSPKSQSLLERYKLRRNSCIHNVPNSMKNILKSRSLKKMPKKNQQMAKLGAITPKSKQPTSSSGADIAFGNLSQPITECKYEESDKEGDVLSSKNFADESPANKKDDCIDKPLFGDYKCMPVDLDSKPITVTKKIQSEVIARNQIHRSIRTEASGERKSQEIAKPYKTRNFLLSPEPESEVSKTLTRSTWQSYRIKNSDLQSLDTYKSLYEDVSSSKPTKSKNKKSLSKNGTQKLNQSDIDQLRQFYAAFDSVAF